MELSLKGELTEAVHQKELERLKNKILLTSYRLNLTHSHNPQLQKKKRNLALISMPQQRRQFYHCARNSYLPSVTKNLCFTII